MNDVKEFITIEQDGKHAPKKHLSFHSDGWVVLSGRNANGSFLVDFSPNQIKKLISFLQSSPTKVSEE